jgi:hypothetical protein
MRFRIEYTPAAITHLKAASGLPASDDQTVVVIRATA